MTAWLLGLLAAWSVLALLRLPGPGPWPWRVADLDGEDTGRAVGGPGPRVRRDRAARDIAVRDPALRDPALRDTDLRGPEARRSDVHTPSGRNLSAAPGPGRPRRTRRGSRSHRRRSWEIDRDLPVAVDLLSVAISAGHSLHTAVGAAGSAGTGPVCRELAGVAARFERGARLVDELTLLPERLGPSVRPLSTTLIVASSSGTPLGPTLQRLGDAERRRLRRRTEERVRRLPVVLLAPLIGLVLPAFVLLTIVPVGISAARSPLVPAVPPAAAISPVNDTDPPRSPP